MLIGWVLVGMIVLALFAGMSVPFFESWSERRCRDRAAEAARAAQERRRADAAFLRSARGSLLSAEAAQSCPGLLRWPQRLDALGPRLVDAGFVRGQMAGVVRRADGSHWNGSLPSHPAIAEMSEGHLMTLLILEALASPDWPGSTPAEKTQWANVLFPVGDATPLLLKGQVSARVQGSGVAFLVGLVGERDALLAVSAGLSAREVADALAGDGLNRTDLAVMAALRGVQITQNA